MSLDLRISQLISNNEPPSNGTMQEIKELLSIPLQELSETNTEIQNIEKTLETLRKKQTASQTLISSYNIILSPARHIPPDILSEIFLHCLPTMRNPIMSNAEAPMLLTHVCGAWRSIALASPHIWARLHIPFPGNLQNELPRQNDAPPSAVSINYPQLMQMRCRVVKEWLLRSGTCPLSLSINFAPVFHSPENSWDQYTDALSDIIISFSERWTELELSLPSKIYERFQSKITMDRVPSLKILRASFLDSQPTLDNIQYPMLLLTAPLLTRLSLHDLTMTTKPSQMPQIWHRLTYLSLHSPIPDVETLDLLKSCHNLVECQLKIFYKGGTSIPYHASSSLAILPLLQSLRISDSGLSPIMGSAFRAMVTPSLKWLDYQKGFFHMQGPGGELDTQVTPFVHLVEGSAATLTKMTVSPYGIPAQDMLRCFELSTRLRHLVIGWGSISPKEGVPSIYFSRPPSSPVAFNLEPFMVPEPEQNRRDDDENQDILLPYLEVFEAYQISGLSDKVLARFICSRLRRVTKPKVDVASSSVPPLTLSLLNSPLINGIATLRKVIVTFDRTRQVDITQEVQDAANEAGVPDFKLELRYAQNEPTRVEQMSPAYGVAETGRSWVHADFETHNVYY